MEVKRKWMKRSLKLAVTVGLVSAGYDAWKQFEAHKQSQSSATRSMLGYECAAKLDDAALSKRRNEFGNVDVSELGCSDKPFFVSMQEVMDMRAGKLIFDADSPVFDFTRLVMVFLEFGIASLTAIAAVYLIIATCQWIWN